jgi:hypothetical protein
MAAIAWAAGLLIPLGPVTALAADPPDLKIEHVGFWAPNDDRGIQFRMTNVGGSRASAGKAHIQTLTPQAGNVAEPSYPALDAGKSFTFKYELAAPCNGHVVRAGVSATADGEKEYDNNFFQGSVCPAKPGPAPKPEPQGPVTRLPDDSILTLPRDDVVIAPNERSLCLAMAVPTCPGEWTITLEPSAVERQYEGRQLEDEVDGGDCETVTQIVRPRVGWLQIEALESGLFGIESRKCAFVAEGRLGLNFDHTIFDPIPNARISKAELSFDEEEAWWKETDGGPRLGARCVTAVEIATERLGNTLASGEPYREIAPNSPRMVDVRSAFQQQVWNERPRFGFLLRGALRLDQLEGNGQSSCMSVLENIRLHVTYVI